MYRLGLRLTLRSGREAYVRLVVTAVAVAIGVAIILAVLADFNAFKTTNDRPSWESTQGLPMTKSYAATPNSELWNYSNDIYQGQTIERLDVAALGRAAPVPPGIRRLPASGQYYASPALASLLRTVPADELGDRFPGKLAGTIGQRALTGPDELVIYVGYAPARLASLPATAVVDKIATVPGKQIWTSYFRDAFVVGAIAFLFPILILVGTATRLAAARREERYASLRLVGATTGQIGVIASVDAIVSSLLGALIGILLFRVLQPALADTAITSARYFADEVTPTVAGYLVVLIGVPSAAAISALLSLRRVHVSPLGVSRRMTPPPPSASRVAPLLVGLALLLAGLLTTNWQAIGQPLFPGLIIVLIGLIVAGPWLTAAATRQFMRVSAGASSMLAARRLADDPRAAFRSIRGLVLAVFLGTLLAGILPAAEAVSATPTAKALSNVLLDGFTSAPVCGNDVNCASGSGGRVNPLAGSVQQQQRIAVAGLPPRAATALLQGLSAIHGATAVPIYSPAPAGNSGPSHIGGGGDSSGGGQGTGIISCAGLRELAVLGQCAPGRDAVLVPAQNLFDDNPEYSTKPLATDLSPAASDDVSGLYLQALLVKVDGQATLERVRTYLITHVTESASGTAPRTFGEAVQARAGVADTVQRLIYMPSS